MIRKLSQEDLDELSFMRDWVWVITDFLVKNEPSESFKEIFKGMYQAISDTFDKKNLRGMRMAYNDSNEMASSLSPSQLNELNHILRRHSKYTTQTFQNKKLKFLFCEAVNLSISKASDFFNSLAMKPKNGKLVSSSCDCRKERIYSSLSSLNILAGKRL